MASAVRAMYVSKNGSTAKNMDIKMASLPKIRT